MYWQKIKARSNEALNAGKEIEALKCFISESPLCLLFMSSFLAINTIVWSPFLNEPCHYMESPPSLGINAHINLTMCFILNMQRTTNNEEYTYTQKTLIQHLFPKEDTYLSYVGSMDIGVRFFV
jgi:hypothetical protein